MLDYLHAVTGLINAIAALGWPFVALIVVLVQRRPISDLIDRIVELKGPAGTYAKTQPVNQPVKEKPPQKPLRAKSVVSSTAGAAIPTLPVESTTKSQE